MKRFPRLRLLAAVFAFALVAAFAITMTPEVTAKPCPPPTTNCPNCAPAHTLADGTICWLVDCLNCGRTICRYEC